jgi:hypothetical protein
MRVEEAAAEWPASPSDEEVAAAAAAAPELRVREVLIES